VSGKGLKFGKIISLEMVLSSGRYLGQNNQKQRSCGRAKQPKTKELWKGKTTKNKGVVEGQNNQKGGVLMGHVKDRSGVISAAQKKVPNLR
jgi:hypothetical protein